MATPSSNEACEINAQNIGKDRLVASRVVSPKKLVPLRMEPSVQTVTNQLQTTLSIANSFDPPSATNHQGMNVPNLSPDVKKMNRSNEQSVSVMDDMPENCSHTNPNARPNQQPMHIRYTES